MTQTLLVDLDDTLLGNDMGVFLPAYLQALGAHLASYAPPEQLVRVLLASTRQMIQNDRPDRSLKEVFDSEFFPALNLRPEDLEEAIRSFYEQVFPTLQGVTRALPQAVAFIERAQQLGWQVAVATNPLFPRTAVLQRLEWAGVPASRCDFRLIASYETFHFAKPNPAYFAEVLGRLGWPEGPVAVIGDDLQNDVIPARRLGLPVFWIASATAVTPANRLAPNARGSLEEALAWIEGCNPAELEADFSRPEAIAAILRATPASLASLCRDLPEGLWSERPKPGEWSLTEILCHLRDVENEVNIPRLKKVLQEYNPFLAGMNTDPWAEERLYICQNGLQALRDFTDCRLETLGLLEGLAPEDWERPLRHSIFGPTKLKELNGIIAGHDRLHIRQACETLRMLSPSFSAC